MKLLHLGSWTDLDRRSGGADLALPAHHLVTHAVVVGMTGSGKTGLVTVLAEEGLRAGVPVIVIDVKGDLPNLLLRFPDFAPSWYAPWAESTGRFAGDDPAAQLAEARREALASWSIGEEQLRQFHESTAVRVLTPGATSGEPLHVLSTLERRSSRWDTDPESARFALSAAVSLLLRLLGRVPDPARSREHVLLSVLAERRMLAGQNAELRALMDDLADPPITEIGAMSLDSFMKKSERRSLAAALNNLIASPTFANWRQGASLDVEDWLGGESGSGRTGAVVVSVAHLDDEERSLVLGLLLEEILSWVRGLRGSKELRAMIIFDEVYGFLPPHPANPPTKRPLVALMKQARGFGVGIVVATQNPMDLDYRALSNAGLWCLGRLQTDADRARVIDGLALSDGRAAEDMGKTLPRLAQRWFVVRNAHARSGPVLLHPRETLTLMRGPMTREEIRLARAQRAGEGG